MNSRGSMLVFGLVMLAAVLAEPPCAPAKWWATKSKFITMGNLYSAIDTDVELTCKWFKNVTATEEFGYNNYRIEVHVPGMEATKWEVKIKHRLMLVVGHVTRPDPECDLIYGDIKTLPHFVKPREAAWKYEKGTLIIGMPYKNMEELQWLCKNKEAITTDTYDVRKGDRADPIFT